MMTTIAVTASTVHTTEEDRTYRRIARRGDEYSGAVVEFPADIEPDAICREFGVELWAGSVDHSFVTRVIECYIAGGRQQMIVALPCYRLENAAVIEARFNRLEAVKYSAEEAK